MLRSQILSFKSNILRHEGETAGTAALLLSPQRSAHKMVPHTVQTHTCHECIVGYDGAMQPCWQSQRLSEPIGASLSRRVL